MAVLHMLTSGSFQSTSAREAFSSFLSTVLEAIITLTPQILHFPNSRAEQRQGKQAFYDIARFPHVFGANDCTHVQLVPPAATAYVYQNRKHTC